MNSLKNINVRVRTKAEMKELPVGLKLFKPVEKYPKDLLPYQKDYADNSNSSHNEESNKRAVDSLLFSSYKKTKTLVDDPLENDRDREPSGKVFSNVQDSDHCRPDTSTINDANKFTLSPSNQSLIECSTRDYESNDGDDKKKQILLNQRNSVEVSVSSRGKEKHRKAPKDFKEFIKKEDMCTVSTFETKDNPQVNRHDLNNGWKKFITKSKRILYKCSSCSYETLSKHRAKRHSLIHCDNFPKLFNCSRCKYVANRKNKMRNHLMQNHDIPSPDDCYNNYNTTEDVNFQKVSFTRIFTQELQSLFACSLCDFETTEESSAESHFLVHSDTKLDVSDTKFDVYKCSECDFETDCNDKFKSHERDHEANLILNLDRKNENKTTMQNESDADSDNKKSLIRNKFQAINESLSKKHILTHDNLKVFKCSQCSFSCIQASKLKRHEKKRHSQKNLFQKTNKNIHNEKFKIPETIFGGPETSGVGNEPPVKESLFKCPLCFYETDRRNNMKIHIKRHEINSKGSTKISLADTRRKEPVDTITYINESVETVINDTSTSRDCCSGSEIDHTSQTKEDSIVENDRFTDDINFYHCSECDYYSDRKVKFQVHLERHCRKSSSAGEQKEGEHQKITVHNESRGSHSGSHSKTVSKKVHSKRGRPQKYIDVHNVI